MKTNSGTYKYYIGTCADCDKTDYFPEFMYKYIQICKCEYCGGKVFIDKSDVYIGKK